MDEIRARSVLQAVLLRVLATHAGGLPVEEVYDIIDQSYDFPDEWYRQLPSAASGYEAVKRQGYADWREVPQNELVEMVNTEPQWRNEIRWARNDLRKQRYLDTTVPKGIWKLSTAGREAAESKPMEGLNAAEQQVLFEATQQPRPAATAGPTPAPRERGRGLRRELLQTMEILTSSMPLKDLRLLVELARAVRRRSLPDQE